MAQYYADSEAPDGGDGTINAPWNTLAAFVAAHQANDELEAVGSFRETFTPPSNSTILGPVGGAFEITGAELLPGIVACDAGDNARIGAGNVSLCRKATISKSLLVGSDPALANLCANGTQMNVATSRETTTDEFFYNDPVSYWTADITHLSGDNITGFTKTSVTDPLTKAQIDQAICMYIVFPNVAWTSTVQFDEGTDIINLDDTSRVYENSSIKDDFGFSNAVWNLGPNQWAYWDEGDGTVTFYFRNLTSTIEYSARDRGLYLTGVSDCRVENVTVRQVACGSRTTAAPVWSANSGTNEANVTLRNILARDNQGGDLSNAAIAIRGIDDFTLENYTVLRAQLLRGLFLAGSGASNADAGFPENVTTMDRALVVNGDLQFVAKSPVELYTMRGLVMWGLWAAECGKTAHSNATNLYQSAYDCIFWGLNTQDAGGYLTWQECDSIVWAFCANMASGGPNGGARWLYHQQNPVAKQGSVYGYLGSYAFNNRGVSQPDRWGDTTYQNGMRFSASSTPLDRWGVANNISPGWSAETFDPTPLFWNANLDTSPGGKSELQATDEHDPAMYADPANGDFAYVPGARVRTKESYDWSGLIPGFKQRWPHAPDRMWEVDMAGADIDWATLPLGPTMDVDHDYTQPPGEGTPGPGPGDQILTGAAEILVTVP